ncbi:SAG-related sequence [Besnoitia besnoiti]|uniref:SAG-related sequence n=1 Tax=Besnoitia besnoiti TaxID=94643 RepID=A0A2A9MCF1_BESBE|nr:SAG-related sequence [Besnoitia besnoiti]PFH35655.1 SAG-related sequence [Besnoitia besnoiti]
MVRSIRMEQRRGSLTAKARKILAMCVGGMLLLTSEQGRAQQQQDGPLRGAPEKVESPKIEANTAACKLSVGKAMSASDPAPDPTHLTLSVDQLAATLVCEGEGVAAVPNGLKNVCQENKAKEVQQDGDECTIGESKGAPVQLATFLAAESKAEWVESQTAERTTKKAWKLSLQKHDLPLLDQSFYVGCKSSASSGTHSACKVPVQVLARHSSTEDNVVTCAYGANSNDAVMPVEITQDHNTLTVVCGKEGSIEPTDYATKYCEDEGLKGCIKTYIEILPNFDEEWWTKVEGKDNSAKLTIPSTDFPSQDKSFYIGCTRTETKGGESLQTPAGKATGDASGAAPATCKVLVTVKAAGSPLLAGSGGAVAPAAFGAALLTGLVAGSLATHETRARSGKPHPVLASPFTGLKLMHISPDALNCMLHQVLARETTGVREGGAAMGISKLSRH